MFVIVGGAVHNLPEETTSFIGRQRERVALADLVRTHRLVTLTGAGGSGKSRLALRVAREAVPRFRDGVWLVELATLDEPSLVPQVVAAVFGVQESANRKLNDALVEFLSRQELLLVLDNVEHLASACRELVEQLLSGCPRLTILATGREALACLSEAAWLVPTLPVPMTGDLKKPLGAVAAARYDAVRLFVERAVVARPNFALTDANAAAVAVICRQLDGIPLAIELAARRTSVLTPEQIADRLADRLRLLTGGPGPLPRHRTLRAAIEWSYELLTEPERRLLDRLSVFAGGWTLEAAEAICAGNGIEQSDLLDLLSELVDKSLLQAEPRGSVMRYDMLQTLRQFAAERLEASGETAGIRRRHLAWFAASSDGMAGDLLGPEPERWSAWLENELDNARTALAWPQEDPNSILHAMRLAANLWSYWWGSGTLDEGRHRMHRLLEIDVAAADEGDPDTRRHLRARLACSSGMLSVYRFDLTDALALLGESRRLASELSDEELLAEVDAEMGIARCYAGDAEGIRQMEQGVALARRKGALFAEFMGVMGLSVAHQLSGRLDLAVAYAQECLDVAKKLGGRWAIACAEMGLGNALIECGELQRAHGVLQQALTLRPLLGHELLATYILTGLARLAVRRRNHARALRLGGAAFALRRRLGIELQQGEQAILDADLNLARQALGRREADEAWTGGLGLTLEQVEEEVDAWRLQTTPWDDLPLSQREREVASLVGRGLTNREIAGQLGIAEGTAKMHVERIRDKLGFTSRAQIAAWLAQQGLIELASG